MRRRTPCVFLLAVLLLLKVCAVWAAEPIVTGLSVEGNQQVVSQHILATVSTRIGEPLDREQLRKDVEAIYGLGFFAVVDVRLVPQADGVLVVYVVRENPMVKDIHFSGNTVYSSEQLLSVVFTAPGTIFNRVFFQNDLQRIREKYQKDGYVLVRIEDVQIEDGIIKVRILEPRVGDIIIQGNKRTKTYVIEREIKLKKGDLFNSTILRHSLNKLQGMGYFEDVNVGFEPSETPDEVTLVLTVEEQKTGRVTFSIGHGSQSGWSGGLGYEDNNWQGLGHRASVGFETGDREQYWLSYEEPYMDESHYAWRAGIYKRKWIDQDRFNDDGSFKVRYDQEKQGIYFGTGKKFARDSKLSWYVTADWHENEIRVISGDFDDTDYIRGHLLAGKNFSLTGTLQRNNVDSYLSYPKGDIESINVEHSMEALGGDFSYTKYWIEGKYYTPVKGFEKYIDTFGAITEDNPVIFAARVRAGFSSGEIPWAEQYFLGGANTLRGFDDDELEGSEMFLANLELRIPMEKAFALAVFYDTGNAWKDDKSFSFSDLKDAWGVGVRVRTPLGNIRLDIAEGPEETQTHFGFGELF